MSWWTTGILAASAVIGAVGTGVSYFGQQQQAANANAVANYNSKIAEQNNAVNRAVALQNATWKQQQAQIQYQTQQNNATTLNQQARAQEAQGREQARRQREANERENATLRARFAKSGVSSEGSPLTVMATEAGLLELGVQDMAYESELQSRSLDRQADNERFNSQFSLIDESIAKYEAAQAEAGFTINANQAGSDLLAGRSQAEGYKMDSYGTLLSGAGDLVNTGAKYYDRKQSNKLYSTTVT